MNRDRYLVKSAGDNIEGTREGLAKFLQLLGQHREGVIVVPHMNQVKDTLLAHVLNDVSPALADTLFRKREHVFSDGSRIQVCSQQTLKNFRRSPLYLVLWGSHYAIDDVEALDRWGAVVFVSWQSIDYQAWLQNHDNVSVIYDDGKPDTHI